MSQVSKHRALFGPRLRFWLLSRVLSLWCSQYVFTTLKFQCESHWVSWNMFQLHHQPVSELFNYPQHYPLLSPSFIVLSFILPLLPMSQVGRLRLRRRRHARGTGAVHAGGAAAPALGRRPRGHQSLPGRLCRGATGGGGRGRGGFGQCQGGCSGRHR